MARDGPRAQAIAALDLAYADPARATRLAREAGRATDPEAVAVAERALGMAATARGQLVEARAHLETAVAGATRAGLPVRAAEARGSLAYLLTLTGHPAAALDEIGRAAPVLTGTAAARLEMQRALVFTEMGRFEDAAGGFADALETLRRAGGDTMLEAGIRGNRSALLVQTRDWRAAEEDLRRAEDLYTSLGLTGMIAMVQHNRADAAALRGDVPTALAAYDTAARQKLAAGRDLGLLPIGRAEVLLSVRLVAEAREAAEQAVISYTRQRNAIDLVQARLLLARAALLGGEHAVALEQARRAQRSAARQRRPAWAALAGYVALRARWEAGERDERALRAARRAVTELTDAGWVVPAMDARLIVAMVAVRGGHPELSRRALTDAGPIRRDLPAELRARMWHAIALLRLSEGNRRGTETALRAGMRILERFRASLGATELRAHVSGHAVELAGLGIRLALESGSATGTFTWAERWRAGALLLRPARPPDDELLVRDLAELREVVARIGAEPSTALLRRQAALEESVRKRAHHATGSASGGEHRVPGLAQLRAALGPAALVEYVAQDGELHAVVLTEARTTLHRLGPLAPIEENLEGLRHGLRRLAAYLGSAMSRSAALTLIEHKASQLDSALLGPLGLGDRPLVLVPTGPLHALPWAALPSCLGRPVSVAPSATLWHRAACAPAAGDGAQVFVAGPGLTHASTEVIALARRYRGARRLTGRSSTVDSVRAALDGATLAHFAAHGRFRADNPLFSAIQLVDGPLTVYDLERLARPPRHVVLSACDSGLPSVRPGDELLGLASALLAMGTRTLIATVIPVSDDASLGLMLHLHDQLRAGIPPATALATTVREFATADPVTRAAALGYLCLGYG